VSSRGRRWKVSGSRPWRSIRARKAQYGCPPGCYAAILASQYRTLPWRWSVTLTAPPGELLGWWREWIGSGWDQESDYRTDGKAPDLPPLKFTVQGAAEVSMKFVKAAERQRLDHARAQIAELQPDAWPFWVAVLAKHPRRSGKMVRGEANVGSGIPHIHMMVGSVSYARMRELLSLWPGRTKLQKVRSPWRILHYLFAQELTGDHAQDVFSHCNNLMVPPLYSENFEHVLLAQRHRERMRRERKKRDWVLGLRRKVRSGKLA
jgi:hypothetical protein